MDGLRSWIAGQIRIDQWDLDLPVNVPTVIESSNVTKRYAANSAIELPIQNLSLTRAANSIEGAATFTNIIVYRFSGAAAKEQLPLKAVTEIINYLSQEAIREPQSIWANIRKIDVAGIDEPVSLARTDGEDGDWLLVGRLELNISFLSLAGIPDVLQPPVDDSGTPFNQLELAVYRALSPVTPDDDTTYIEDTRLTFDPTP
jgi:hypothetical protein